jgi:hypothetical protein
VISKIINLMAKAPTFTKTVANILVIGLTIKKMEKVSLFLLMEINIKVNSKMINSMAMVNI